jgi:hypothetical protein
MTLPGTVAAGAVAASPDAARTTVVAGSGVASARRYGLPVLMLLPFAGVAQQPVPGSLSVTSSSSDRGATGVVVSGDPVAPVAPGGPSGVGVAAAGAASGLGWGLVAVLLLALGWFVAQRLFGLVIASARCRPVAFCWLLERPG